VTGRGGGSRWRASDWLSSVSAVVADRIPRPLHPLAEGEIRLPRAVALEELRGDILRAAYVEGDFVLTGGIRRHYYIDKYLFETRPGILRRLAAFMSVLIPAETDRIAAPALGAVAIGTAITLELGLPLVIVRPNERIGTTKAIEGELYPGESITLIEDVVVTGSRAMLAVARVEAAGARVRHVVAVVDRSEGASERFAASSIGYHHLFTPEELGIG
jgi:orotate phosphoribosyltransferase